MRAFGGIALHLAAVLAMPAAGVAQSRSSPLPVKVGQHAWVTATDGAEIEGVITESAPATIDVLGKAGTTRMNLTEVRRVATRDSLKNGAIIGASVLGGLAILGANGRTTSAASTRTPVQAWFTRLGWIAEHPDRAKDCPVRNRATALA